MKIIKKNLKLIAGIVVIAIILGVVFSFGRQKGNTASTNSVSVASLRTDEPTAVAEINQNFDFELLNANSQKKMVKFTVTTVERKEEIKLKDQTRKPTKDKDYLLVRIEIQNDHIDRLAIASGDRVRLQDDSGKLFAPDYHNGAVIIEPLSVKKDLLAFVVDKQDKSFVLQVGDLEQEKQKIEINF